METGGGEGEHVRCNRLLASSEVDLMETLVAVGQQVFWDIFF